MERLIEVAAEAGDDFCASRSTRPPRRDSRIACERSFRTPSTSRSRTRQRKAEDAEKAARIGRSPRELFAEYLEERGEDDPRVRALFDELLEEVYASD